MRLCRRRPQRQQRGSGAAAASHASAYASSSCAGHRQAAAFTRSRPRVRAFLRRARTKQTRGSVRARQRVRRPRQCSFRSGERHWQCHQQRPSVQPRLLTSPTTRGERTTHTPRVNNDETPSHGEPKLAGGKEVVMPSSFRRGRRATSAAGNGRPLQAKSYPPAVRPRPVRERVQYRHVRE